MGDIRNQFCLHALAFYLFFYGLFESVSDFCNAVCLLVAEIQLPNQFTGKHACDSPGHHLHYKISAVRHKCQRTAAD